MRFWDSSAIVPLLVEEPLTSEMCALLGDDSGIIVWWTTEIECVSALARLERDGHIIEASFAAASIQLQSLKLAWNEIQPINAVRDIAKRLLRIHPLRTGDALHLAAAIIASNHHPENLIFVCNDIRLTEAARKEGFICLP